MPKMRAITLSAAAVAALILGGCGGGEEPEAEVNPPAEGAEIVNENPTSPEVDIPGTPADEGEEMEAEEAPAGDEEATEVESPEAEGDEAAEPETP